jgi:hypothetical protein
VREAVQRTSSSRLNIVPPKGGRLHRFVQQKGLPNIFNFGNGAFEVESFAEDDFEDLFKSYHLVRHMERGLIECIPFEH